MKSNYCHIIGLISLLSIAISNSCTKKSDSLAAPITPVVYEAAVTILTSENKQVIQGFGCATVFNPPNTTALTSQEFDRLFASGNGQVGLNFLRIRIASDDAWREVELNNAKAAMLRGAKVFASPWSPPPRMKTNNSIMGTGGKLKPDSAAAYAKYLNDFAVYMAANAAPLYAVSVQNEPDWAPDYEGCAWTATEMRDFLKNHGALISATRLMAPELVNNNQTYINTILSDDAATANIDIVGTHIYGGGIVASQLAAGKSKEVWMTEHLDTLTTFEASLNTAVEIHDCFTKANFSAYIWWYGKRFYGLIGQDGAVTKRGYIVSQFSRFIKEGAMRLGSTPNSRAEVLISAYKNGPGKVIVAINSGPVDIRQKISFQGASAASVIPYLTNSSKNVEQGPAVSITDNSFTYTVPSKSIVTFVEQ